MSYALYIASAIGAVALLLMMPREKVGLGRIGALLGAATLGGLWLALAPHLPAQLGMERSAFAYYYIFSALSLLAAVRVITHTKPVYSALWFVMVVLSSSGLFLALDAEFMAIALVIIYGGAILVTYLFVIMLAAEAGDAEVAGKAPMYDRVAREPVGAIAAGFLLLALLLGVAFEPLSANPAAASPSDRVLIHGDPTQPAQPPILTRRASQTIAAQAPEGRPMPLLAPVDQLDNIERVGLDLFRSHLLSLELAGVILLVSLIGAVVIARQRVETES